jgi:hypothetical protein
MKKIYNYFFLKQYRIKEYNSVYDFNMNPHDPLDIFTKYGWIFVTNEISKFKADIFMMKKMFRNLESEITYSIEKVK